MILQRHLFSYISFTSAALRIRPYTSVSALHIGVGRIGEGESVLAEVVVLQTVHRPQHGVVFLRQSVQMGAEVLVDVGISRIDIQMQRDPTVGERRVAERVDKFVVVAVFTAEVDVGA